jgi:4-hydroxy-3-methylbut-2-en-1-yl diphosphate reductase
MGMCGGVRRALSLVDSALADDPSTPVFTLGELVHNPAVVAEYRARGVVAVDDPGDVTSGIIVIRTHGVGPAWRAASERPGVRCIDATCPRVLRIQELVRDGHARGWTIIVVGDARHDEVRGIAGHAPGCRVVGSVEEARTIACAGHALVVGQTTLAREEYEAVCAALRSRCPDLEVADTTCPSTESRRDSIRRLAADVDAVLVVGSPTSANARWLHAAATAAGTPSWLIAGPAEIPSEVRAFGRVGISAGASTPDAVINEVERALLGSATPAGNGGRGA